MAKFRVYHDDQLVEECDTYNAAWMVIHKASHGASVDWQMKHEGWRIVEVEEGSEAGNTLQR